MLSPRSLRRLFEGGVYSGCGVYSRKYGILFILDGLYLIHLLQYNIIVIIVLL